MKLLVVLFVSHPQFVAQAAGKPPNAGVIAARVNGEAIPVAEIEATIADALGTTPDPGGSTSSKPADAVFAATLERAIDRRLVCAKLERDPKLRPNDEAIAAAQRSLAQSLVARGSSLEDFQAARGWSADDLRRYLTWRVVWPRYLRAELNDAALESHFNRHHGEFDGTLVRVSHLLLRLTPAATDDARQAVLGKARRIREEVTSGNLSFVDAVRKYSESPSREQAGDQGFLPRRGVMVESFSRAAFALKVGETSQPVVTPFGVHLIHCTEFKPGKGSWTLVRDDVARALAGERFALLAKAARTGAKIEYLSGAGGEQR
ncbi:MAG: peptidylprolyl isomerase [Pirellulales bacterium]|nr:peptidylprolyl isomerase [Pirellulales bacterium]